MSFESLTAIFVHFPKTGGSAVHFTADAHNRKLRHPPDPADGHRPASWFGPTGKPSWTVLREPVEWYVSMYRFCVDAGWSVLPDLAGSTFPQFVKAKPMYYDDYCRLLEIETVDHLYPFADVQMAYNLHVGPEPLQNRNISRSPKPVVTDRLARMIRNGNPLGVRLYNELTRR